MNQPLGSCQGITRKITTLTEELGRYRSRRRMTASPEVANNRQDTNMDWEDELEAPNGQEDMGMGDDEAVFVERYEGAGMLYGPGTTFMDQFDRDPHASKRTENVYYPFASKNEWELASFLARSNLSMASINSFLSLALVSS